MPDTTTPGELVTDTFADVSPQLIEVLLAVIPAVATVGLLFWGGRLVLGKLGLSGKVARI
jgi:hypothetical protein